MRFRSQPMGWRNESYRHSLASKGIKTRYYARPGIPYVHRNESGESILIDPAKRLPVGGRSFKLPIDAAAVQNIPANRREILRDLYGVRTGSGDITTDGQLALLNGRAVVIETVEHINKVDATSKSGSPLMAPGVYVKLAKGWKTSQSTPYIDPATLQSVKGADGNTLSMGQVVKADDGWDYKITQFGVRNGVPVIEIVGDGTKKVVVAESVRGVRALPPSGNKDSDDVMDEGEELFARKGFLHDDKREGPIEYIDRNFKSNDKDGKGLERFQASVKQLFAHPMQDLDAEWKEYTSLADNERYGKYGKSERLAPEGSVQRWNQRGAALFGRVASQANVEPLVDTKHDRTYRELLFDVQFGRRL